MKVIKRYPNRKLYSTELKRYIDTNDILDLIANDMKFIIIDKATRLEATSKSLLNLSAKAATKGQLDKAEILANYAKAMIGGV